MLIYHMSSALVKRLAESSYAHAHGSYLPYDTTFHQTPNDKWDDIDTPLQLLRVMSCHYSSSSMTVT